MGWVQDAWTELDKRAKEYEEKTGESLAKKETPYTQGVYIEHGTGKKGTKWSDYGTDKTVQSLRSGETIRLGGIGNDTDHSDEYLFGGVGGTRYLGKGIGDYISPDYFSNENISDNYSPLQARISSGSNIIGDINVYYDDNGAIAGIDLVSDFINPNTGTKMKKKKIRGATDIANFFKKLDLDNNNYSADKFTGDRITSAINFGGGSNRYMPTDIFGSKGALSGASDKRLSKDAFNTQYGANSDWRNYWHNQRINK